MKNQKESKNNKELKNIFILPVLGRNPSEYPGYQNCYLDKVGNIVIFVRQMFSGEENAFKDDPNFLHFQRDGIDYSNASYTFKVPEEWAEDFEFVKNGDFEKLSQKYFDQIKKVYPEYSESLDQLFNNIKEKGLPE